MDVAEKLLNLEALSHDVQSYDYFVQNHTDTNNNSYMEPIMDSIAMTILGEDYNEEYSYKMMTDKETTVIVAVDKEGNIVEDFKLEADSDEILSYNQMWDRVSDISDERLNAANSEVIHEMMPDKASWPTYIIMILFVLGLTIMGVTMFM